MKLRDVALLATFFAASATAALAASATDDALIKQTRLEQNAAIVTHDLDAIASF